MAIADIYSERRSRGETPDVYRYDELPKTLRIQIVHIWEGVIGNPVCPRFEEPSRIVQMITNIYKSIVNVLCEERGVYDLEYPNRSRYAEANEDLHLYFVHEPEIECALHVIRVCFAKMDEIADERLYPYGKPPYPRQNIDTATEKLNRRFREHGIGYSYENGQIIRKDGELIHESVVEPCLRVLGGKEYRGAQEEFLRGHEHYRKGNMKEAMNECVKAFESVMKVICRKRRWRVAEGAGASKLISVCLEKGLVPPFWQQQFTSLKSLLEGGAAPARNRLSGHGQGAVPIVVPRHVAAFALHMTAAAILFLAEAEASGAGK